MNENVHFNFDDFTEDPRFIEWVRSGFKVHDPYWRELESHNPSMRQDMQDAIEFIQSLHFKHEVSNTANSEALLNRIHETLGMDTADAQVPGVLHGRLRRLLIPLAAAASIALLVFMFWGNNRTGMVVTPPAVVETIQLPDASKVIVNAGSTLRYNKKQFNGRRMLTLEGEAFFEVEKGGPFIVETPLGEVEVLGTSFNIYSREDYFAVECVTGRVNVTNKRTGQSVILEAGEEVDSRRNEKAGHDGRLTRSQWVKGQFNFMETRLETVLEELERQFDVDVKTTENIKNLMYTGFFKIESLDQALHAVTWPLSLTYEIQQNVVVITQ